MEPLAMEPLAMEPLAMETLTVEPLAMEPLEVEPLAMEPLALEPLAMEPLEVKPLAMEPLEVEPLAKKPLAQTRKDLHAQKLMPICLEVHYKNKTKPKRYYEHFPNNGDKHSWMVFSKKYKNI